MRKLPFLAAVFVCFLPELDAQRAIPPEPRPDLFGTGIGKTMTLLSTSTPDRRHSVRILFYGQSISKQEWWVAVAAHIRVVYPFADLTIENRAIGGYSSDYLIQTVAHDVYTFYPDLVIFHDFGGDENYEKIIAGIRQNTTAEILIQNDFPTWTHQEDAADPPDRVKGEAWHERHSHQWLPDLCRRYNCEVVDVRTPWYQYLADNKLKATDVLSDGTHLNAEGNRLLAEITKRHFRVSGSPSLPYTAIPASDLHWNDGKLTLEFEGNRIDVVAESGSPRHEEELAVKIDKTKPSAIPELYAITRPTDTFSVDWPAVNRVTNRNPLVAEDWTLKVVKTNPNDSAWVFSVSGSKTGPDGEGDSTKPFVSNSGRVVIDPHEWGVQRAFDLRHQLTPVGFEVHWSVVFQGTDTYRAPRITDTSKEYVTTLAQGLPNTKHTLELSGANAPPIREIRVYHPAVAGKSDLRN